MPNKIIIKVSTLRKHFKIYKHHRGMVGALRNLVSRQYQLIKAVDDISFQIKSGELVGYLGPNGAGKSTTLKMLSGLLVPTSGELVVNGSVPWQDRQTYVGDIGAVFGQRTALWWDLPVIESFDILRHIYKLPIDRYHANLKEFQDLLDLDAFMNTPVRSLSLGQRMRADICAALLHDPKLLFLDEPTIGLDVVAKDRIRNFITHMNRQKGTTIILTTHDLSDVEKLCERVLIIDRGKLLYDGGLLQLQDRFGGKRKLIVEFSEIYKTVSIEGAELIVHNGQFAEYLFDKQTSTASELIGRLSNKYRIRDLEVREPEIENTVRRIYEERLLDSDHLSS